MARKFPSGDLGADKVGDHFHTASEREGLINK
jgi:hypothetical protein